MEAEVLISTPESGIFQLALNRPRQLNALSNQTIGQLQQGIDQFVQSEFSVMVLTGTGRAFCFGADFLEFQDPGKLPVLLKNFQAVIKALYECPKITIAALNGFATGAGFDLALACDFRIASDRVKLGEAYIGMGLVSDGGGSFLLPRLIGHSRALRMLLTGEAISAEEALRIGLLHGVCAPEDFAERTLELARELVKKPQVALRELKRLVRENSNTDFESALAREADAQAICFQDKDHQRILQEFLKKRT